jgi:hypothetical protein
VGWRSRGLPLALALGLAASVAGAQDGARIEVEVLVCQTSEAPGGIDGACEKVHAKLKNEFRYESLKLLQSRSLQLGLDEVGGVKLPNGKSLRVRPLQVSGKGALLAVDVEGAAKMDLKVRNGHLVVIGAERYQGGKLVISLEPRW